MANFAALIIKAGVTRQISIDVLTVGTGIDTFAAGPMTIGGTNATSISAQPTAGGALNANISGTGNTNIAAGTNSGTVNIGNITSSAAVNVSTALNNDITLNTSGTGKVHITGNLAVDGTEIVTGGTTYTGLATFNGGANFAIGAVTFNNVAGTIWATGSSATFNNGSTFTTNAGAPATFNGSATFNGGITANGANNVTLNNTGTTSIGSGSSSTTIGGGGNPLTLQSAGGVIAINSGTGSTLINTGANPGTTNIATGVQSANATVFNLGGAANTATQTFNIGNTTGTQSITNIKGRVQLTGNNVSATSAAVQITNSLSVGGGVYTDDVSTLPGDIDTSAMPGGGADTGFLAYASGVTAVSATDSNSTLNKASPVGIFIVGIANTLTYSGIVFEVNATTAGGMPAIGAPLYLAAAADDGATGAGKVTATKPLVGFVTVVGYCLDNSNYVASKVVAIMYEPQSPIAAGGSPSTAQNNVFTTAFNTTALASAGLFGYQDPATDYTADLTDAAALSTSLLIGASGNAGAPAGTGQLVYDGVVSAAFFSGSSPAPTRGSQAFLALASDTAPTGNPNGLGTAAGCLTATAPSVAGQVDQLVGYVVGNIVVLASGFTADVQLVKSAPVQL